MKPFLKKLLKNITPKSYFENDKNSNYRVAKRMRNIRITVRSYLRDFFLIALGIFSASFGFKGFLLTNKFIDGGATGISLLVSFITHIPLSILIFLINIPFIIMGYRTMGMQFAVKTALAILGLSLCLAFVTFPIVTDDKLLVAVFGGFFLGAGIGFAMRGGAVIDGTEVLAIFLSRKFGMTIGDIILVINILIYSAAAYFLGIEIAMYSTITYLAASKTLDFFVEGLEEYIGVSIVSNHNEEIREMIINTLGRGVTIYYGRQGYVKGSEIRDVEIVYSVITRLEINKLNVELEKIDEHAFVVMHSVKDTKGGMIKKRPLK